jgi:hypothetical protein
MPISPKCSTLPQVRRLALTSYRGAVSMPTCIINHTPGGAHVAGTVMLPAATVSLTERLSLDRRRLPAKVELRLGKPPAPALMQKIPRPRAWIGCQSVGKLYSFPSITGARFIKHTSRTSKFYNIFY